MIASDAAQSAPDPVDGREAWMQFALSMVLGAIGSAGLWSVVVVLPRVQAEFGVDRADASLPYTLTMIGFAVGNMLIGRYVDRVGARLPVMLAGVVICAGYMLAAASPNLLLFTLAQGFAIGIGTAANFGPLIANISHWFRRRRGIAVAGVACGNYLAGALWSPLIEQVAAADGWRFAYVCIGLVTMAIVVPMALLLKPPPGRLRNGVRTGISSQELLPIDLSPRALQLLLAAAGVGCCVAMSMPQVHIVAYCADLGYGVARGAEMLSLMMMGGVISRLLSGWLADRIGGVRTLLLGSSLQALALLFYLPYDGLASLYIVSALFGLSQGGIVPSYAIIVREYLPAEEAGQRVGMVIFATVMGMALGGWLSGWIFDITNSYETAFVNGIAFNLLNISVIVMILWRTRMAATAAPA